MFTARSIRSLAILLLAFGGTAGVLQAGTITSAPVIVGPGLGSVTAPLIVTGAPNNDDFMGLGNNNNIVIQQKIFANLDFVDIVFFVVSSGGTSEYFLQESVLNSTGFSWLDYHVELGFGTGSAFVPSPAGDGLDFDAPVATANPTPTHTAFPNRMHMEDAIWWFGGTQPNLGLALVTFSMDIPDGISQFTLRQTPTVPEPSTLILFGLGALGLVGYHHWRRRKRAV